MIKKILWSFSLLCFMTSCAVVKEYEKINLNDPDMALADKKSDRNITTFIPTAKQL